jgi:putative phosphoesterase
MKIGILSDTHDDRRATTEAVGLLAAAGASLLVHCGGITGPPILAICARLPTWFVLGNHDADTVPDLLQAAEKLGLRSLGTGGIFEAGGKRIGVTHGHITVDVDRVSAKRPDFLLAGHTHAASDTIVGGIRRIHPGSLFRADELTVALFDLAVGRLEYLKVSKYPGLSS